MVKNKMRERERDSFRTPRFETFHHLVLACAHSRDKHIDLQKKKKKKKQKKKTKKKKQSDRSLQMTEREHM